MSAIARAGWVEETYRLDSVAALNVARGVNVGHSGSPEAWDALVAHATGSPTLGKIERYRAEVALTRARVESRRGPT